jgi:hypothetical protein
MASVSVMAAEPVVAEVTELASPEAAMESGAAKVNCIGSRFSQCSGSKGINAMGGNSGGKVKGRNMRRKQKQQRYQSSSYTSGISGTTATAEADAEVPEA